MGRLFETFACFDKALSASGRRMGNGSCGSLVFEMVERLTDSFTQLVDSLPGGSTCVKALPFDRAFNKVSHRQDSDRFRRGCVGQPWCRCRRAIEYHVAHHTNGGDTIPGRLVDGIKGKRLVVTRRVNQLAFNMTPTDNRREGIARDARFVRNQRSLRIFFCSEPIDQHIKKPAFANIRWADDHNSRTVRSFPHVQLSGVPLR